MKEKNEKEKQKLLLVGLSYYGRELLKYLSADWRLVAMDSDDERVSQCREELPDSGAVYHTGAADSVLTWKKLDTGGLKYIITTLKDVEVNLELCRIARKVLKLKIPIIVLNYGDTDPGLFEPLRVRLVNSLQPTIHSVMKQLDRHVTQAVNVGLEKGELIEVTIKARSHLVNRELRFLRPSQWHISALYRDGKLILPDGNSCLKVGDRVLLAGDPKMLENVAALLLKGEPQFPLQYGPNIMMPLHEDFQRNAVEASYWLNAFKARQLLFLPFEKKLTHTDSQKTTADGEHTGIGPTIELFREIFDLPLYGQTGVLIVPADRGLVRKSRVKRAFRKSVKPFLLSRLSNPYEGVVISLNGPDPAQAMESGLEIARLLGVGLRVVYCTVPKAMRGIDEKQRLRLRHDIVSDFEGIYREAADFSVLEGNPVRETLKYLAHLEHHLFVVVTRTKASLSILKPNVPYLLARQTLLSTLVIPEAGTNE
jgi:Trk K+ transport system NAD-binding subunit